MARKRSDDQHHALPKYVYIRRGWYIYRPHLGHGKLGKDVKLCPANAQISEVWQRYESIANIGAPRKTIDWLFAEYLASSQHAAKAVKTRKEYEKNANTISNTLTKAGDRFGMIDAERITPGVIRKYIDARSAPVSANREKAFMSICFSYAVERDLLKTNPAKQVRGNKETARDRYVTDEEYNQVYNMAAPWPLIQCAMELAYMCRMRLCEVLDLKQSDIQTIGLLIRRRKGSKNNITTWTERLNTVIYQCDRLPTPSANINNPHLIRGQRGDKLTEDGFSTLWQRLMVSAAETGMERFTFHDLKRKAITDTVGDKMKASGHKSQRMMDVYDVELAIVQPAGKEKL